MTTTAIDRSEVVSRALNLRHRFIALHGDRDCGIVQRLCGANDAEPKEEVRSSRDQREAERQRRATQQAAAVLEEARQHVDQFLPGIVAMNPEWRLRGLTPGIAPDWEISYEYPHLHPLGFTMVLTLSRTTGAGHHAIGVGASVMLERDGKIPPYTWMTGFPFQLSLADLATKPGLLGTIAWCAFENQNFFYGEQPVEGWLNHVPRSRVEVAATRFFSTKVVKSAEALEAEGRVKVNLTALSHKLPNLPTWPLWDADGERAPRSGVPDRALLHRMIRTTMDDFSRWCRGEALPSVGLAVVATNSRQKPKAQLTFGDLNDTLLEMMTPEQQADAFMAAWRAHILTTGEKLPPETLRLQYALIEWRRAANSGDSLITTPEMFRLGLRMAFELDLPVHAGGIAGLSQQEIAAIPAVQQWARWHATFERVNDFGNWPAYLRWVGFSKLAEALRFPVSALEKFNPWEKVASELVAKMAVRLTRQEVVAA